MVETEVSYLDDQITVTEPEPTFDELVATYGKEAVREEAINNFRYRNKHPRVYKLASKELESVAPRAKKKDIKMADGSMKPVLVSHINHCRDAYKADATKTSEVISRIAASEPLYVKGERTGGTGRIAAGAMDAANNSFADGEEEVERVTAKIEGLIPGYKVLRDEEELVTPESLARAIMALEKYLQKQAREATKQALAR